MPKERLKCPKCGGKMGPGFLLDFVYGEVHRVQTRWVSGAHEPGLFTRTKLKGKNIRKVEADRCEACGYLELFARVRGENW